MQSTQKPELQPLNALVGEWATEATHPAFPSTVVHGRAVFEWLEGEQFLIQCSQADHPDFPDATAIIGAPTDGLSMHYFDSRGVHRVYEVSLDDGIWRIWRDSPGFSQRFTGTFGDGGDTLSGLWQLSRDGSSWDDDLEITYRRVRQPKGQRR
jgi:hypothetical protein